MQKKAHSSSAPMILIILDGWGIGEKTSGNAITSAKTPNFNSYFSSFPNTTLEAAGESVGLPHGEAGNSEVGHLNIGSGRTVYQDLPRINTAIADGSFLQNKVFTGAVDNVKKNNSKLHIMGLIGSGGVHSSIEHLYALLWLSKQSGVKNVYLHLFTDGRDSPPTSAQQLIRELDLKLKEIGIGQIVTISGRYFAMDRDNRWEKTERVYNTMVKGEGIKAKSAVEAITKSYEKKIADEFIEPTVVGNDHMEPRFVSDSDSLIFINFRPDRARQLSRAFVDDNFSEFLRERKLKDLFFVSMTQYDRNLATHSAFPAPQVINPLAFVLSSQEISQLHIGETEKYAHVTYFFNGGVERPFTGEKRIHIPSPKIPTYDAKPEMSAYEITGKVLENLKSKLYGFYVINFANADMVAHTGSFEATVKGIETLDTCVGKIVSNAYPLGATVIVVGDHGNAEQMINPLHGGVDTEHSSNPVPFLAISEELRGRNKDLQSGILADVSTTILSTMGITKPQEMTGRNLLMD